MAHRWAVGPVPPPPPPPPTTTTTTTTTPTFPGGKYFFHVKSGKIKFS